MSFDIAGTIFLANHQAMDITKFMTVVEDLADNGGTISLAEALLELGDYIEHLDPEHQDYDKNVVLLMRIAASIWKQQRISARQAPRQNARIDAEKPARGG